MRIPHSNEANTRVEHRIAGADANPYLVTAAVLAGMLHGIENGFDPGPPVVGNAYEPVSYTHLDVYKRQFQVFSKSSSTCALLITSGGDNSMAS